jgi:hypothetical protein
MDNNNNKLVKMMELQLRISKVILKERKQFLEKLQL